MTCLEHSQWLRQEGHEVINLVKDRSELAHQLSLKGQKIVAYKGLGSLLGLRRKLQDQPSLVIYQQLRDLYIAPWIFSRKTPSLGYLHMFLKVQKRDPWHRFLYRWLDELIVLTASQKQNALKHLPLAEKQITTIPNGVDLERFRPLPKTSELKEELGWKGSDFLVGVVGRMDPQKGQMETLEALKKLHSAYPQLKMVFVGEDTVNSPGTKERMLKYIQEEGLEECAQVHPFRQKIESIFSGLDLFLMPSYAETFGRVLIEAMAAGVPVVGTRAGGVVDIIEAGRDGLLAEPRSAESLSLVLKEVLEHPEKLLACREEALKKVKEHYSLSQVRRETLKLFYEATGRSQLPCI